MFVLGLGDALGVDWASLVAETRPKLLQGESDGEPGAARRRWEPTRILQRIGISLKYAGSEMYNQIQEKAGTYYLTFLNLFAIDFYVVWLGRTCQHFLYKI